MMTPNDDADADADADVDASVLYNNIRASERTNLMNKGCFESGERITNENYPNFRQDLCRRLLLTY